MTAPTDTPKSIWLRWQPGAAVTQGPLTTHPEYTEWVRRDVVDAEVSAALERAAEELGFADVQGRGLDSLWCCTGYHCGCQGVTVADVIQHRIRRIAQRDYA